MAIDPVDKLPAATVGDWAEDKYLHVEHYARMFAKAMKGKWGSRAYLELFAGPGRALIEGTEKFIDTAPLRALMLDPGFDVHIYGEIDLESLEALGSRCHTLKPGTKCVLISGDVNESWPDLRAQIRESAGSGTSLTFCFVDPYRCADLAFETIAGLSEVLVDFLVLIPSYMDANRNASIYLQQNNENLDRFFGDTKWRDAWKATSDPNKSFGSFVADQFGLRMKDLGFLYDGLADMKLMRSTDRKLPLYHLAFFSRNDLGLKLWKEAMKSSDPQRKLF